LVGFSVADDVLIYSLSEHRDLIFEALSVVSPARVVEIGSEAAGMTRLLAAWAAENGAVFTTVEPYPIGEVRSLAESSSGSFELVEGRSPEALAGLPPADVYLVDGDHNHWTVLHELEAIYADGRAPLTFLHDVGWPCARRDQYYSVDALPADAVLPHSHTRGRAPGSSPLVDHGFGGAGEFAVACEEGGPANGVLTAVEDFLSSRSDLTYAQVPAVFGLGVVWSSSAPYAEALSALVAPWHDNRLLARLEENRVRLYALVLELQDRLTRADAASNLVLLRYAERVAALEAENASLRLERGRLRAELDAAAAAPARGA
jgi:Methyltransferase domain